MSSIDFRLFNITIMSVLMSGLASNIGQYLDIISCNGGFPLLCVVISMKGSSSFFTVGSGMTTLISVWQIANC